MATTTILDIRGYDGQPVPNRLLRPRGPIDRLVALLPGYGYTLDMPLFYYIENRALEVGADVLRVEYVYNRLPAFQAAGADERRRWLLADAEAALRVALEGRAYRGVALVGKSLGTAAMAHLLAAHAPASAAWTSVWLTPLLAEAEVRAAVRGFPGRSLVVIGTDDPHHDPNVLAALAAQPTIATVVVEGAEHGMDIPGDPVASVRALERIVAAQIRFLPSPEDAAPA
jgi:hypothetical protein